MSLIVIVNARARHAFHPGEPQITISAQSIESGMCSFSKLGLKVKTFRASTQNVETPSDEWFRHCSGPGERMGNVRTGPFRPIRFCGGVLVIIIANVKARV